MEKRNGPYVGVTGFMSRAQVQEALKLVPPSAKHKLMVGVLMSDKTLAGGENSYPKEYPRRESVADIFIADPRVLNLVHFNTHNVELLSQHLAQITRNFAGQNLHGFQLNITWPSLKTLDFYRFSHPEKLIVLQIGKEAMKSIESDLEFRQRLIEYDQHVDAVLIDMSGGAGKSLNPLASQGWLETVRGLRKFDLGIAGGLGPWTLSLLDPLIPHFSNLSIDAQGNLQAQDGLGPMAVRVYLEDAFYKLAGNELPGVQFVEPCRRDWPQQRGATKPMSFAQPCALQIGDCLATHQHVISRPRREVATDGGVWLHLEYGSRKYWLKVPREIPIAILSKEK